MAMKLTKEFNMLRDVRERLENRIEQLEVRKEAIDEKAIDRDLTEKEQDRMDAIDEQIDDFEQAKASIEEAIDYLENYVEG